jgi:hypothetical protein
MSLACVVSCTAKRAAPKTLGAETPVASRAEQPEVVPAETEFVVELQTELSSITSRPGQPIRALTLAGLEAANGSQVVPEHAEIRGYVLAVRPMPDSAIVVRIDHIITTWGEQSVRARFTQRQPDPSVMGAPVDGPSGDSALMGLRGVPLSGDPSPGGLASPVVLPPGARLQMVLAEPLVAHARVLPPGLGGGPVDRGPRDQ